MLDSFAQTGSTRGARKRVSTSIAVSTLVYLVGGGSVVAATAVVAGPQSDLDELIEVEFAAEPEMEAAPPPPPPVEVQKARPRPRAQLVAPDAMPNARPEESDGALAAINP